MIRTLGRWQPVVLTLLVVAPLLAPGYVLAYDMVFVPDQAMRIDYLGLGAGLPRAVPSDALVAIASVLVPGQLLQKAVLVAIVAGAGFGMRRLMAGTPLVAQIAAVSWFVWNPYVAERLMIGQWAILVGYAALPWLVRAALDARAGSSRAVAVVVLVSAISAVSASGGLVAAGVGCLLACWPGSALTAPARVALTLGVAAVNAPWVVAGLLHRSSLGTSSLAVEVFAASGDGRLGPVGSVLGLGGIWNADVVPSSRSGWAPVVWLVVLAVVVAAGIRPLVARVGGRAAALLGVVALTALVVALAGVADPGRLAAASRQLPGFAMLRDGPRYLGGLAVVQAMAFGLGVHRLARWCRPHEAGRVLAVALAVAPLAVMPDLAWGAAGRLQPVDYPSSWAAARDAMTGAGLHGSVLVLPLAPYRAYPWNGGRAALDPAPRFFPGASLASDALSVDGVVVQPEDPVAARAAAAFEAGDAAGLAAQGVGFVVVDLAPADVEAPAGLSPVYEGDDLAVWQVPDPVEAGPGTGRVVAVTAGWTAAGAALVTAGVGLARARRRRRAGLDAPR